MNEKVKQFIQGIGMLTELWTITYNGFKNQGLNDAESIRNTKEFMSMIMESIAKNEESEDK